MNGLTESEKALEKYVAELARFSDNPVVAEYLIRVQRNLLFRSRAFSNDDITRLLDRVRRMATPHSQDAHELHLNARESVLIALQATASERKVAALDRYRELRAMIGNGESADPSVEKELIGAFQTLAWAYQGKYPATLFSIWSDLLAILPHPPSHAEELALFACTQIIPRLAQDDALAAFVTWAQVTQWSRAVEDGSKMAAVLVTAANSILLPNPDQPRELNEVLWEFIKSADSGRGSSDEGITGRMMSLVAAVDMVVYLTVTREEARQALIDRLRQGGAIQWESDEHMSISREAIGRDPELTAALEAYEQPMAETLAYAEKWLHPDLVTHDDWPMFVTRLQKLSSEVGLVLSLGRFEKLAIQLDRETKRQHVTAAQERLILATADAPPWIDRPLAPLEWSDVEDETEIRKLASPLAIPGKPFHAKRYAIERLRMAKPSFYPDGTLVEVQVENDDKVKGIVFYLLLPGEQVVVFDGTSGLIHAVNGARFLENMDQPATVFDYLLFFTYTVWGEEGPFRIVRRLDEIPFRQPPSKEAADRMRESLVENPQVVKDIDDDWRVETSVQYGNAFFRPTFEIKRGGMVEMLTDEPVVTDLAVQLLRMAGPMRVFRDEEAVT
jgi:hypothetical protein